VGLPAWTWHCCWLTTCLLWCWLLLLFLLLAWPLLGRIARGTDCWQVIGQLEVCRQLMWQQAAQPEQGPLALLLGHLLTTIGRCFLLLLLLLVLGGWCCAARAA
jgi:hypothetical protein